MASGIESDEELDRFVRDTIDAFNRVDVEAYLEFLDPEVRFRPIMAGQLEGEIFEGHDGVRRYFKQRSEFIESAEIEVEEVRRVTEDRVLILGRWRLRGRGSGATMESPWAGVCVFRDGKILDTQGFGDQAEAEIAAGARTSG